MRYFKLIVPLLIIVSGSCNDSYMYTDDNYSAPCRIIVKIDACGVTDIGNNLAWLHEIIIASLSDQTGVYRGKIWCKQYNGQDYIVTDMPLEAGGVGYHTFTCTGEPALIDDTGYYNSLTQKDIVWISFCITPGTDS